MSNGMNQKVNTWLAIALIAVLAGAVVMWARQSGKLIQGSPNGVGAVQSSKNSSEKTSRFIGQAPQAVDQKNKVSQLYVLSSPDKSGKSYLEKEYDQNVKRFVRQSIVVESIKNGKKVVVSEVRFTPQEAIENYDDKASCKSRVNFDEFKPIRWINDDLVLVAEYADNYECVGTVVFHEIYNKEGEKFTDSPFMKQAGYNDFSIENVCLKPDGKIALILGSGLMVDPKYAYAEFDPAKKVFSSKMNQLAGIEKQDNFLLKFKDDCAKVTNIKEVEKYFKI